MLFLLSKRFSPFHVCWRVGPVWSAVGGREKGKKKKKNGHGSEQEHQAQPTAAHCLASNPRHQWRALGGSRVNPRLPVNLTCLPALPFRPPPVFRSSLSCARASQGTDCPTYPYQKTYHLSSPTDLCFCSTALAPGRGYLMFDSSAMVTPDASPDAS